MTRPIALLMASATLLGLSSTVTLTANAVAAEPANLHANRTESSTVIGTLRAAARVQATDYRNGWCATGGGYVRASKLSGSRAPDSAARVPPANTNLTTTKRRRPTTIRRPSGAMAADAMTNTAHQVRPAAVTSAPEHPGEDRIHVLQMVAEIELGADRFR
jgi:hypothetical protein